MRSPLSLLSAALLLSPALQALVSGDYVDNSTECDNTGNPWLDHVSYVNSGFAHKLDETVTSFLSAYDADNAGRTKTVQKASTFLWVTAFDAVSLMVLQGRRRKKINISLM
jgi:cellulose 1,4-beta-cellobiosidase